MKTKIERKKKKFHIWSDSEPSGVRIERESICIMHICISNGDWVFYLAVSDAMRKLIRIHSPIVHKHSPNGYNLETYLWFVFLFLLFFSSPLFISRTLNASYLKWKRKRKKNLNKFMLERSSFGNYGASCRCALSKELNG